ncbi:MAG: alpha-ketoacid dehydrogenase subunit beta [Candidatus Carbobacillus altaicus]|uniref:Pyruvate dehydrogenase E1 component beta subunit n=1 Tax=Candidatus Carbonibacillus altaicus TaxID=2163959 RepID=A0A2R6XYY6_9BACL|nr:alpha-ketoacid dehydrogenase subunit beta [Candidatus Carbobacillus altaicus]PTQ55643.1 MAG: Pyruvate dehydrogenase E1 component beta subunit [Candidatus Carbobacillus altaicus]
MPQMTMVKAIHDALALALEDDERVLVFGEDVGKNGGVFRVTEGLQERFGKERVFDTPLAESAIGGLALGLAYTGFRPVAEIQFFGFIFEMFDELANQIARTHYRYRARYGAPIVIRSPFGGGVKAPELHADSFEGLLAQTPGLFVAIPSNPYDAKGLLLSAIDNDNPVVFLEHMKLYRSVKQEVPEGRYEVPLGEAKVVREGEDVTIITYGAMVKLALKAAEEAAEKLDRSVEVIDLRTIVPLDMERISRSVKKTGRAIVLQEAPRQAGIAAEVMARLMEEAIYELESPVLRVAPPHTPYAFNMIEDDWLPSKEQVIKAIEEVWV